MAKRLTWKKVRYLGKTTLLYTDGEHTYGTIECHVGACAAYVGSKHLNGFFDVNEAKKAVEKAVGRS